MLRVPVNKIEPGMVLARPISSPHRPHKQILPRDREIPMDLVPWLGDLGIREVWIRYRGLEFLETLIDEALGECQRDVYCLVRKNFERLVQGTAVDLDIAHFERSVRAMFEYLQQSTTSNVLLQKLGTFDNYLLGHSTNVCYLAMLLGMKLEKSFARDRSRRGRQDTRIMEQLALGCLLHDIGKMRVPPEILHKSGPLAPEEMEQMRLHPLHGHEMVRDQIPPLAADIVLHHHQRYDGNGYPRPAKTRTGKPATGMSGKDIPILCRIATVVDIYDAATSDRVYSSAKLPVRVLYEMRTVCQGFFDPDIEQAFYQIVPAFPIGQVVTLSNGVEGVVVDFNCRYPTRPKVRGLCDPAGDSYSDPQAEEIDLAREIDLSVVAVGDVDVTPFLPIQENPLPDLDEMVLA